MRIRHLKNILLSSLILVLFSPLALAAPAPKFTADLDYKILPQQAPTTNTQTKNAPIEVIEFFSYGCPGCFAFEPYLEKWVKSKNPKQVTFKRVPVVFHPQWEPLAKAYYIANGLGIAEKITPDLFNTLQVQHIDLMDTDNLAKFFQKYGVSQKDFNNAFNSSPTVDAQLKQGTDLMNRYQINLIPAVVIQQKYLTNMEMAQNNPSNFTQIMDFLINKELAHK